VGRTAGSWQQAESAREAGRRQLAAGCVQAESRAQRAKGRTPCAMRFARVAVRTAGRRQQAAGSEREAGSRQQAAGSEDQDGGVGRCTQPTQQLNRLNNSTDSITQQRAITFQGTQRCTVAGRRGTSRRARRALGPVSRTARTGNAAEQSGPRSGVRRHRTHDA